MTTVVESLERIARQCSVKSPTSWVTASRNDHAGIRDDFLADTVDDILDRVDLPAPISAQVTLSTLTNSTNSDGSRTFTLPTNFKRVQRDQFALYDKEQDRPCVPVTTDGEFSYLSDVGTSGVVHFYKVEGYDGNYTLTLYNDPTATTEIILSYCTVNWMASASGTAGKMLTADDDVLLLPRRVVEVGTIWRFREDEGLPYLDKYNEYEALLTRMVNDSRGRRAVNMGEVKQVRWQDMVPSFIPDA